MRKALGSWVEFAALAALCVAAVVGAHFTHAPSAAALSRGGGVDASRSGFVTIGDGIASRGVINIDSETQDAGAALQSAVAIGSSIHFLRGSFVFRTPFASTEPLELTAEPGATFNVGHAGPIGALDLGGDGVRVSGLNFIVDRWSNDQIVVQLARGRGMTVVDCSFNLAVDSGNDQHPMVLLDAHEVSRPVVQRCRFLPNVGCIAFRAIDGNRLDFSHNEISNGIDGGFGPGELTAQQDRRCLHCVFTRRQEWARITDNVFFQLGDYANVQPIESAITIEGDTSTEAGHTQVSGNLIESVYSVHPIVLRGAIFVDVTNNSFGPCWAGNLTPDACHVLIDASTGDRGRACDHVSLRANSFHGPLPHDQLGCIVRARACQELSIVANTFEWLSHDSIVSVDTDGVSDFTFLSNRIESVPNSTSSVIHATPGVAKRWAFAANVMHGIPAHAFLGGGPVTPSGPRGLFVDGLMDAAADGGAGGVPGAATRAEHLTTNLRVE